MYLVAYLYFQRLHHAVIVSNLSICEYAEMISLYLRLTTDSIVSVLRASTGVSTE